MLVNCIITLIELKSLKYINIILLLQLWYTSILQMQSYYTSEQ